MMDRMNRSDGFRVLDGVALVMGAAVASVHIREVIRDNLSSFGWTLVWCTFTWVSITATGPFLLLVRRFAQRSPGYPRVGDKLWAVLGVPWILGALVRSVLGNGTSPHDATFSMGLMVSLVVTSLIALGVVWTTWVMVSPEQASRTASRPWTNRIGLFLAIGWPIQCGIGLVVIS
jgi:hypothetical protein